MLKYMDRFISHKKIKLSPSCSRSKEWLESSFIDGTNEEESTDVKLTTLVSLYPHVEQSTLLDILVASNGSVDSVCQTLKSCDERSSSKKSKAGIGYQSSLSSFRNQNEIHNKIPVSPSSKPLTRKGQTLHLYAPEDVETHTPCSIIHNFLPAQEAENLLKELLQEATTFEQLSFKVFDNVVQSPHTACFYVDSLEEQKVQRTEYLYNGSHLNDVRQITPQMRNVSEEVRTAVNKEIANRIQHFYPGKKTLMYQSPHEWLPNAAFVNCYKNGAESVGYHCDQLTYLGPRAVIGSLSLGVAREFRVRKITARDETGVEGLKRSAEKATSRADAEGQIAIHLPHNSLLVMHAEMQEEWKHSIHPAPVIDPHPISGTKRINITYRYYRESFHPRYTPRCKCNVATVLRCVQRKKENRGRYMWMCHAGLTPGKEGCNFFQWAEFDEDGEPPWKTKATKI